MVEPNCMSLKYLAQIQLHGIISKRLKFYKDSRSIILMNMRVTNHIPTILICYNFYANTEIFSYD